LRYPNIPFGDADDYDLMARSLLAGRGLAAEELGFVRPPGYAVFVAACYMLGGLQLVQLAQVALGASTASLIALLARRFSGTGRGTWGAGLVASVYPWYINYVGVLATETLFTFLVVLVYLAFFALSERPGWSRAVLTGLLFGVASLVRTNLLVLAPGLLLVLLWKHRRIATSALFAAGVALPLLAFSAYGVAQGYGPAPWSSLSGVTFFGGNSPMTAAYYRSSDLSPEDWQTLNVVPQTHPRNLAFLGCDPRRTFLDCVRPIPIAERGSFFYEAAFRYMRSDPGEWAWMTVMKMIRQWTPWVEPRAYSLPVVLVSGISFGLVLALTLLALRRMPPTAVALLAVLAVSLTLATITYNPNLRFRFPILDPALIAASGAPVEAILVGLSALVSRRWHVGRSARMAS
jgi:4-amino-4-deoxy-L-arabinose transferase-like glycosyltransferase